MEMLNMGTKEISRMEVIQQVWINASAKKKLEPC